MKALPTHWRRGALPVLLLAGVAALTVGADIRSLLSPGVVSKGHDEFAGNCDACHLVFDGVPDAKCLKCHQAIAGRMSAGEGFHAKHGDEACASCHPDHRGYDFRGTTDEALQAFDHAETGFALRGGHSTQTCAECHGVTSLDKLGEGCSTCHADPHSSALGTDCADCHTDGGWHAQLKTLAEHVTPTDGGHAGKDCEDCHTHGEHLEAIVPCSSCHLEAHDGTASGCHQCHEVAAFKPAKFDHGPCTCAFPGKHQTVACLDCHPSYDFSDTPTNCAACHQDDQKHDNLGECARCHTATSWKDGEFDHDRQSKFKIAGAHLSVSCTQCHQTPNVFKGAANTCAGCHQAAGDTAHGDFGPCEKCHVVAAFAPSTFDHASTGFALTGRHIDATCQSCHAEKVKGYPN
jgi:hypothetical protein